MTKKRANYADSFNLCSAHPLDPVNNCAKLLQNPASGLRKIERTRFA